MNFNPMAGGRALGPRPQQQGNGGMWNKILQGAGNAGMLPPGMTNMQRPGMQNPGTPPMPPQVDPAMMKQNVDPAAMGQMGRMAQGIAGGINPQMGLGPRPQMMQQMMRRPVPQMRQNPGMRGPVEY